MGVTQRQPPYLNTELGSTLHLFALYCLGLLCKSLSKYLPLSVVSSIQKPGHMNIDMLCLPKDLRVQQRKQTKTANCDAK